MASILYYEVVIIIVYGKFISMLVDSHKRDCGTLTVKRLYIRDSINAKQTFLPCGVICCCCGVMK